MCFELGDECGIGRRGHSWWECSRQHKPVAGSGEPFNRLEQGVHRFCGRKQTRHVDVGRLLVGFIDDLDPGAGAPRNADELVVNVFAGEELLEDAGIVLAEKACHGGREADIRQERGDVDPFTTSVELHHLRIIDRVWAKMIYPDRVVYRGVERYSCDSHRLRTSAAVRHCKACWAMRCISESERLRMCAFTVAMLGTLTLSSDTPSPVKIAAPFGSPAMPPHSPTHLLSFLAACTVLSIMRSTAGCSASACLANCGCSRSMASVYWVRSLVPMEKKSISCAK